MSAHGSPRSASIFGTVAIVQSSGFTSASSAQVTGVETRPIALRRTEYGPPSSGRGRSG